MLSTLTATVKRGRHKNYLCTHSCDIPLRELWNSELERWGNNNFCEKFNQVIHCESSGYHEEMQHTVSYFRAFSPRLCKFSKRVSLQITVHSHTGNFPDILHHFWLLCFAHFAYLILFIFFKSQPNPFSRKPFLTSRCPQEGPSLWCAPVCPVPSQHMQPLLQLLLIYTSFC